MWCCYISFCSRLAVETSWSSIAITNKASPLEGNTTAWAGIDFPPHPVGRGASRPLNNQPRAYAGALNPPAAAQAPMPPTAWQQPAWQQPAWQQPAWRPGSGVASQMSSLSLDDWHFLQKCVNFTMSLCKAYSFNRVMTFSFMWSVCLNPESSAEKEKSVYDAFLRNMLLIILIFKKSPSPIFEPQSSKPNALSFFV